MPDNTWVSGKEASHQLGVNQEALRVLRERGYLKHGTHWRCSKDLISMPSTTDVVYHLRWCREEIDHWLSKDAPINDIAA